MPIDLYLANRVTVGQQSVTLTYEADSQDPFHQPSYDATHEDEVKFSVFKTSAPDGKQNEIDTGATDVTAGP